jgi:hypothetical protein
MTYVDSLGTVTNGGVIGSAFQDQPVLFTVVVQTPAFTPPGETQSVVDFTLITNPANATLPVPAGAINLSEVTECYQAYRIFDFASLGDVTPRRDNPQENPPFVGNYGRSIIMRKNPNDPAPVNPEDADIVPPEFTGSIGSGALTFVKNYNNNLVELECTQKSNDGMADQIVRLAGNPFLAVQTEICHNANGTTGVDGIDGTDNAWAIRTFDGFNNPRCIVPLFNGIEYDVGDTISMGIQTAGEAGGNVALQFAVNLGGQSIVYDPIHSDDEGLNGLTWTPILEMITSNNTLIGVDDTAEYKVNARQDHYKDVNIYPNEVFTNWVEGTPVTTTLPSLSANLAPFTWKDVVASTAVVAPSIDGDVVTINAVGATTKAFAHCPRVVGITYFTDALTYLAEIEITSLTTTQTIDYVFEARSPNTGLPNGIGSNDAARFGIVKNGNELYLKTVTWQGFVLTDYTRLTYTGTGGVAGVQMFGGTGHQIGDQLTMTGGSGIGLVLEVTGAFGGEINSVSIFNAGTGYREYDKDNLSILSSTGSGTGFSAINTFNILDDGNYQYSAGDRLSLMIGTDRRDGSPSGRRTFIAGLVKRAGQAPGEVDWGINGSSVFDGGTEFEDYLLFMGHDAVPATESVVITSKFKAADMHPDIKTQALAIAANFPAPVPQLFDLEGVAIT